MFSSRKEESSSDEISRIKQLSFNDYDESTMLLTDTPDDDVGVNSTPMRDDETDDCGMESESEPVDEGAVLALSVEEIR